MAWAAGVVVEFCDIGVCLLHPFNRQGITGMRVTLPPPATFRTETICACDRLTPMGGSKQFRVESRLAIVLRGVCQPTDAILGSEFLAYRLNADIRVKLVSSGHSWSSGASKEFCNWMTTRGDTAHARRVREIAFDEAHHFQVTSSPRKFAPAPRSVVRPSYQPSANKKSWTTT